MKRIYTLSLLLLVLCSSFYFSSCSQKQEAIPALLERKKQIGPDDEKKMIQDSYNKAIAALKKNPDDLQQYINLAAVFISEGRVTGNSGYYGNAAVQMLNKVIESSTGNKDIVFQALSLKSVVELNMHQFKDALATAQQGVAMNHFNSGIYGALVDANVEMGNYDDAVKDCDTMLSIRPDLRSYSRASYLRQIYGQNRAAIDAMKMAVEAGLPGAENTEWARVTLGDLYLNAGNIDSAGITYRTSLVYRPGYVYATMGMAKVERAKKNYDAAINYTTSAIQVLSESAFVSFLADLYELKGDAEKAKETRDDVVSLLEDAKKDEPADAVVKHNVNRELAMAYLNDGKLTKALEYANNDLSMRPDNIDANELVAWIDYLKGDYANAKVHADKMMVTHTQNMNTLYKAGAIYTAAGDLAKGNQMMQEALAISPYVDQRIINETRQPVTAMRQ